MNAERSLPLVIIMGADVQGGTYILRINLPQTLYLTFGRFRKGKVITVPSGEYVYVGSALSEKGALSLSRRLIRHATRSGHKAPHAIRAHMIEVFDAVGLGTDNQPPRDGKKLYWNVDYLLDQGSVDLTGIIAIRNMKRLEPAVAGLLENDPCTGIIEKGLGANDASGNTHLLRVECGEEWWRALPEIIRRDIPELQ